MQSTVYRYCIAFINPELADPVHFEQTNKMPLDVENSFVKITALNSETSDDKIFTGVPFYL
jgi:hypothetical protein